MTEDTDEHRARTSPRDAAPTRTTRSSCCRSWSRTCASTAPSCVRSGPAGSSDAHLLQAMTPQEMAAETTSVYDNYVEVLETGSVEALQHYARDLSERIIPRGVETHEVVGIVLLLRDVLARSLFEKYQQRLRPAQPGAGRLRAGREPDRQHRRGQLRRRAGTGHPAAAGLDPRAVHAGAAGPGAAADPADHRGARHRAGPAADRAAARAASAPTGPRSSSSTSPASPDVDEAVANHLVRTVDASRLMGASVIITGLSPEIAQTLVTIGVDLSKMNTIGDLQGGLEEAERLLGYTRDPAGRCRRARGRPDRRWSPSCGRAPT